MDIGNEKTAERNAPNELARDVRVLGDALGEVLKEQGGPPLFDQVEALRTLAKARRAQAGIDDVEEASVAASTSAGQDMDARVNRIEPSQIIPVLKAFTTYFQLVNLAEMREIVRVNQRRTTKSAGEPRPESVRAAIRDLVSKAKLSPEDIAKLVESLSVQLVFTAHPTEARRRSVQTKLYRLSDCLNAMQAPWLSVLDKDRLIEDLKAEIEVLWQTDEVRSTKLTVLDEAKNILLYFGHTLWAVTPRLYEDLNDALSEYCPGEKIVTPLILSYGSWVGGDRDGNPTVTLKNTQEILDLQRRLILEHYINQVSLLRERLSESLTYSAPSQRLLELTQGRSPIVAEGGRARPSALPGRAVSAETGIRGGTPASDFGPDGIRQAKTGRIRRRRRSLPI